MKMIAMMALEAPSNNPVGIRIHIWGWYKSFMVSSLNFYKFKSYIYINTNITL